MKSPSSSSSYQPSMSSVRLSAKTNKLAKSYFGDLWKDIEAKPGSLSSTLEKLYVWEKKLYEEVKVKCHYSSYKHMAYESFFSSHTAELHAVIFIDSCI